MDDEKQQLDHDHRQRARPRRRPHRRAGPPPAQAARLKTIASEHAPQLVAGGAVVGLLVGFGFPKLFKRVIQIGLPVAVLAYSVKKAKASHDGGDAGYGEI